MYAVIKTGGKQYKVKAGDVLAVELLGVEDGTSVKFDEVLLVRQDDETTVGQPMVAGAVVHGTVLGLDKGEKLVIFRKKRRKTYEKKNGHRQHYSRVRIDSISIG
ncbi:MAG: 50S ribosomal protein L21 [Myxococcales bacterium]|nr:50S ribosomal protein L21 [Myxococcales bacterium]